ncbi:MAG: TIGR04282 family arsenosugar biosynthesis glycosyltransferase [Flavobacterium sp.]|uniref:TIGR04282 family arsenosugar biosynthesis glycosyltransferase n=1 Tax=Flavobacterium sp. TaxID=239 RepID=UPI002623F678|nr:TIGR04282 family arsenosugar biosynthesis glycosyltransferase [Flavobacterium sp.]MDD5149072.1 TIGR04282 family arsenosugar biosynthesis glycosyltransferase [Flavobacterium sp.]
MKTNALIIFTRNPQLGKVKTRLAKTIGNEKALEIYKDLLLHTMNETQNLDCDKFVFYDENIETNDLWSVNFYEKKVQFGSHLGAKMQNAFQKLFDLGYQNCIIIGSDLFDLKSNHINEAFNKLESNDVIIGPAEDGGYYLLGLKKVIPSIFKNKNWGTSTVLPDTLKDLENYKIEFLETLNDIDTFEDLEKSNYYKFLKNS